MTLDRPDEQDCYFCGAHAVWDLHAGWLVEHESWCRMTHESFRPMPSVESDPRPADCRLPRGLEPHRLRVQRDHGPENVGVQRRAELPRLVVGPSPRPSADACEWGAGRGRRSTFEAGGEASKKRVVSARGRVVAERLRVGGRAVGDFLSGYRDELLHERSYRAQSTGRIDKGWIDGEQSFEPRAPEGYEIVEGSWYSLRFFADGTFELVAQ
jgi:hypothetical protein